MREAKVEYDDIADIHWWMVDHIHYLPAMIYACIVDRYSINRCHHQTQQGAGARRGIGTIEDRMQCGSVPAWDAVGVLYSISVLVR